MSLSLSITRCLLQDVGIFFATVNVPSEPAMDRPCCDGVLITLYLHIRLPGVQKLCNAVCLVNLIGVQMKYTIALFNPNVYTQPNIYVLRKSRTILDNLK